MTENPYQDIIDLPHHVSPKRKRMSQLDRAAQFSPFAALTGYEDAIREEARLTSCRRELAEDEKIALDRKFRHLDAMAGNRPWVAVTCFQPDERKAGGAYVTREGYLAGISQQDQCLLLEDGCRIHLGDIWSLESPDLPEEEL